MPKHWELRSNYDYRFAALVLQVKNGALVSPVFQLSIADMLRQIPAYELRACMALAAQEPYPPAGDIEEIRRTVIEQTDVKGKTVLDIGGYDGWAAKLALDLGAKRAICLDNHQYEHYGWEEKKKEGVEYRRGDLFSWRVPSDEEGCPFNEGNLDVIIFYNVLYHLKNPWAALDRLREIIKPDGVMLVCTLHRYHDGPWIYIYEPRECNPEDETVYFGPSLAALERLLRLTGWDAAREGLSGDRVVYGCKPTPDWERKHEDS